MSDKLEGSSSPFASSTTSNSSFVHSNSKEEKEKRTENQEKLAKELPEWDLLPPKTFIRRGGKR